MFGGIFTETAGEEIVKMFVDLYGHGVDTKTIIVLIIIATAYKLLNRFAIKKMPIKSNTVGEVVSSGLDMIPAVPLIKNVISLAKKLLK